MKYNKVKPYQELEPFIHFYWELKGNELEKQWVSELSKLNITTVRQLERNFKKLVGLSPKEYSNIIRFQHALNLIKNSNQNRSLSHIAFECGYYDHAHLSNEIKKKTGLSPSLL